MKMRIEHGAEYIASSDKKIFFTMGYAPLTPPSPQRGEGKGEGALRGFQNLGSEVKL